MNINDVYAGIKEWNDNTGNAALLAKLHTIRALHFEVGDKVLPGTDLHVYLAIDKSSRIRFYLISSTYDNKNQSNIADYIVEATIDSSPVRYTSIPGELAKSRIKNWADDFDPWLGSTIAQSCMFRVFVIPGDDLEESVYTAYFGLRPNSGEIIGPNYWADLILVSGSNKVYEDTVMPVPPFGLDIATQKNKFFLLQ